MSGDGDLDNISLILQQRRKACSYGIDFMKVPLVMQLKSVAFTMVSEPCGKQYILVITITISITEH